MQFQILNEISTESIGGLFPLLPIDSTRTVQVAKEGQSCNFANSLKNLIAR